MYKFENGFVFYDEKTRDKFIKAGYKLVEEKPKEEAQNSENDSNNQSINSKPRKGKETTN